MNARTFYETVKEMRRAQKRYFATRSYAALAESKSLEKTVDEEIVRVESLPRQATAAPSLF